MRPHPLVALVLLSLPLLAQAETVGSPQRPGELQQEILAALKAGAKTVRVAPGRYTMPAPKEWATLLFVGLKDVVLDFRGVDLSLTSPKDGIGFVRCENITFRGATIHYDRPLFSQGRILATGSDEQKRPYYDVQIDAGYPYDADFRSSYIFDQATRRIKFRTWDASAKLVEPLGQPGKVRVIWGNQDLLPPRYNVAVGDALVCRGGGNSLIKTDGCTTCTFQDLTLHWGGVFGIFEVGPSSANHYQRVTITRGPVPPGATQEPLISQSADGLHSAAARVGPFIEGCTFEYMCDDAFAIHGYLKDIIACAGATLTVKDTTHRVGDIARVSNLRGYSEDARVTAIDKLPDRTVRLTLDRALEAKPNDKVGNPSASGGGYRIVGNTIRGNRARGILVKGDHGVITDNTIDGSTMSGISVGPEYYWNEGDYCRSVVIRGNTIRNVNYATNSFGRNGAILIHGDGAQGNRDIVIEDNRIENVPGANLIIQWAAGVSVRGNTFTGAHQQPVGNDEASGALVWLQQCSDVRFSGNTLSKAGAHHRALFFNGPGTSVVPAADGIVVK